MTTNELTEKALKMIADKILDDKIKEDRNHTLIHNLVAFINTEFLQHMTEDEKLDLLIEEIGFTDEEINNLNIKEWLSDSNIF